MFLVEAGWHTRLMLVFPLDLEDVEEVGCCRVHLDEVLVRGRLGVRELRHFELMGPLQASVRHPHTVWRRKRWVLTLTYCAN